MTPDFPLGELARWVEALAHMDDVYEVVWTCRICSHQGPTVWAIDHLVAGKWTCPVPSIQAAFRVVEAEFRLKAAKQAMRQWQVDGGGARQGAPIYQEVVMAVEVAEDELAAALADPSLRVEEGK